MHAIIGEPGQARLCLEEPLQCLGNLDVGDARLLRRQRFSLDQIWFLVIKNVGKLPASADNRRSLHAERQPGKIPILDSFVANGYDSQTRTTLPATAPCSSISWARFTSTNGTLAPMTGSICREASMLMSSPRVSRYQPLSFFTSPGVAQRDTRFPSGQQLSATI